MWNLINKIEDRNKPIDEAFFDKFKKDKEPDISIQLVKKNAQDIISDGTWMCSGYNNNTIKSDKDLTEDKIAGFIQQTITQQIINYYVDNRKPMPTQIDVCAFTAKDVERAIKAKPSTYTNNFTFFIFFKPEPALNKDEMNDFWKHSGYSLFPTSALFNITNENVIINQTAIPVIPYDELNEASKRNKVEVKKKIGNVKLNLSNGKVETQDIISDIVRKATGQEHSQVYVDPLTGKTSMNVGEYEISW